MQRDVRLRCVCRLQSLLRPHSLAGLRVGVRRRFCAAEKAAVRALTYEHHKPDELSGQSTLKTLYWMDVHLVQLIMCLPTLIPFLLQVEPPKCYPEQGARSRCVCNHNTWLIRMAWRCSRRAACLQWHSSAKKVTWKAKQRTRESSASTTAAKEASSAIKSPTTNRNSEAKGSSIGASPARTRQL